MARFLKAALWMMMSTAGFAFQRRPPNPSAADQFLAATPCDVTLANKIKQVSTVLNENPGGLIECAREVVLRSGDGTRCAYSSNTSNHFVGIVVDEQIEEAPGCCSLEERAGMGTDNNSRLLPFSKAAFDAMGRGQRVGVDYLEIAPESCTNFTTGCPLVVEIPGNGGVPWLMVRNSCNLCRAHLGVMMVSPVLQKNEDTSAQWVNSMFIPFVQAYLQHRPSKVDPNRLYLVSASRGNEIALTAALSHPALWKYVLMTGKFRFTPDIRALLQDRDVFRKSYNAGLEKIALNVGDVDPIFPNQEFYANVTSMMKVASRGLYGTVVSLNIYPEEAHATSPGVWTKLSSVIWSGTDDP